MKVRYYPKWPTEMIFKLATRKLLVSVGRSDMREGQTFEKPHTYMMKCQSNATSKSQASKK
jgi:hypothetical protein